MCQRRGMRPSEQQPRPRAGWQEKAELHWMAWAQGRREQEDDARERGLLSLRLALAPSGPLYPCSHPPRNARAHPNRPAAKKAPPRVPFAMRVMRGMTGALVVFTIGFVVAQKIKQFRQ